MLVNLFIKILKDTNSISNKNDKEKKGICVYIVVNNVDDDDDEDDEKYYDHYCGCDYDYEYNYGS